MIVCDIEQAQRKGNVRRNEIIDWHSRRVSEEVARRSGRFPKSFAAPRTIRRVAARRAFQLDNGKPVVLTIGVPQPVPGSDWGCLLEITGLNTSWRRPRYVYGIDGLQALHLAMKCATDVLASAEPHLAWLGQKGDVMLPRFLPDLPRPQQALLEAIVQRETVKYLKNLERAHKAKPARKDRRRQRRKTAGET